MTEKKKIGKKRIAISVLGIILILALVGGIYGIGVQAKSISGIPPASLPPGFTKQQVDAAKNLNDATLSNMSKIIASSKTIPGSVTPYIISRAGGSNNLYATICCIEDQYTVYNNFDFQVAVNTQIWDSSSFTNFGGYNPVKTDQGLVTYNLYYWNYPTNSWEWQSWDNPYTWGWTDANGNVRVGFIIPYNTYSDKFYISGDQVIYQNGRWYYQEYQKFFTVNWE